MNSAIQRHPALAAKAVVLRPGAQPPDVSGIDYQQSSRIHIGHFGSLSPTRNLKTVFEALDAFLRDRPAWHDLIRIHIYGGALDHVSAAALTAYRFEDLMVQHGRLEHDPRTGKSGRRQILEAMRHSDALILLHGNDPGCLEYIPSKLYEYLLVHRPIFGLAAPGSELEKLLRDAGHYALDANNPVAVQEALSQLIEEWWTTGLPDHQPALSFTVRDAVEQLIRTADRITQHSPVL